MANKRTLNAKNLEALGAAELAELLIEVSGGNAVIQRRLRLALAAAEGGDGAAREVRKRLTAIARATTFIDSGKRKALLADLEAQHQAITGPIAAANPAVALELLLRFLELADAVLRRCSDTTGAVVGVFRRAVAGLAPIATAASLSPEALAESLAELLQDNGYGQFDQLIPSLAPFLGDGGLAHLQNVLLKNGGIARFLMAQIAQGRGDVEAYLELFDDRQLGWPDTAAEVGLHLLKVGRAEQALAVLDRAATSSVITEACGWHDTRITVLETLGRSEEAQQHRWQIFCQSLSLPHLREYLRRLDDFQDVEAEERAFALVEQHPMPLLALEFLVGWPALPRAARYVIEHWGAWDGDAFEIYGPAAERLSADHPLPASLLLRSMVVFALSTGHIKRYRYAAEHLRHCELLAARIDDWQGFESHTSFAGRLREIHALKRGFWTLVER